MNRPPTLSLTHEVGSGIRVLAGDRNLVSYRYRPTEAQFESPRPYLHPVHTLGGKLVTVFRPHDHVWHKGIALSLPNVGPDNFWGGASYRRDGGYVQLENNGSMNHKQVLAIEAADDRADFAHELLWHTEQGAELVREQRRLGVRMTADPDAWTLTFTSTLVNVSGTEIEVGSPTTEGRENAGYGGLFWRGPRSFTGGVVIGADGSSGEGVRGERGPWAGFSGRHDDEGGESTVVMVDAVENPRHPPQWFVRSEPFACMNPAPFFSETFALPPDAPVTFSYAVVIADGGSDHDRMSGLAELGRAELRRPR